MLERRNFQSIMTNPSLGWYQVAVLLFICVWLNGIYGAVQFGKHGTFSTTMTVVTVVVMS